MKIKHIIAIAISAFIIPFIIYFLNFNGSLSSSDQSWSNFGSFIGGIGATIFSFASFITVLITYDKNKLEKLEDEEKKMIFQLFDLLDKSREKLLFEFSNQKAVGVEAINRFNAIAAHLSASYSECKKLNITDRNGIIRNIGTIEGDVLLFAFVKDSIDSFTRISTAILEYIKNSRHINKNEFYVLFSEIISNQEKTCIVINKMEYFESNTDIRTILMDDNQFTPNKMLKNDIDFLMKTFM